MVLLNLTARWRGLMSYGNLVAVHVVNAITSAPILPLTLNANSYDHFSFLLDCIIQIHTEIPLSDLAISNNFWLF